MVWLVVFMLFFALALIVVVAAQPPGTVPRLYDIKTYFALVFGYMNMFKISYNQSLLLCVIPCLGTSWAMMYVISKQLHSMASSHLLPHFLTNTYTSDNLPLVAYAVVCICGFCASVYAMQIDIAVMTSQIATLAGCFVYVSMFYCYCVFKFRYSHMERTFKNPLGLLSVFLGVLIYFIGFLYVVVSGGFILLGSYLVVMICYYFCHARMHQVFSQSEQEVFFKAYVMKSKSSSYSFFSTHCNTFASFSFLLFLSCFVVNTRRRQKSCWSRLYAFLLCKDTHRTNKIYVDPSKSVRSSSGPSSFYNTELTVLQQFSLSHDNESSFQPSIATTDNNTVTMRMEYQQQNSSLPYRSLRVSGSSSPKSQSYNSRRITNNTPCGPPSSPEGIPEEETKSQATEEPPTRVHSIDYNNSHERLTLWKDEDNRFIY
jgi:hypothetical protein